MTVVRKLPQRERVFITSLCYHGFRRTERRKNLKLRHGYVIPSTQREDASGIDCWVKMPNDCRLFPVQVTQRGVRIYRRLQQPTAEQLQAFVSKAEARIAAKRKRCHEQGIAFVLVRDYIEANGNQYVAMGDIRSLRFAIANLKRWL